MTMDIGRPLAPLPPPPGLPPGPFLPGDWVTPRPPCAMRLCRRPPWTMMVMTLVPENTVEGDIARLANEPQIPQQGRRVDGGVGQVDVVPDHDAEARGRGRRGRRIPYPHGRPRGAADVDRGAL